MRGRALAAALLLAAGCGGPDRSFTGAPPRAAVGAPVATVERGSVTRTVVVQATVVADARVRVTAPAAGTYYVTGGTITYRSGPGPARPLRLPTGVEVVRPLIPSGTAVPANYPVADARVARFALVAPLDAATTYKLYDPPLRAVGEVKEGPGPFPCPLADRVPSSGDRGLTLACVVPPDLRVFAGMPALVAVTTGEASDVLLLPVEAVAGTVQRGVVWLLASDGRRVRREVELGLTDGARIEVRTGLREGDRVLVPGPDLLPGPA